jgi:4-diphosphocytidyl-2-C-methyl-D-erythritol kinase
MKEFTINAPAKLNFGLQVLNKREDGYHNINTVFIKVGVFDIIKIKPSEKTIINTSGDFQIDLKSNLIYKALEKLSEYYNKTEIMNFEVNLEKNIPIGAGMGGGSSDAAAIIKFACEYFKLTENIEDLIPIASKLGADIPFFLKDGDALGSGIGDILEYFSFDLPYYILIVFPEIHISTPEAYKALKRTNKEYPLTDFRNIAENITNNKIEIKKFVYNDFEKPVFNMHKDLLFIKQKMIDCGATFTLLTGSGSAIFSFFEDEQSAINASKQFPEYRTFITKKL